MEIKDIYLNSQVHKVISLDKSRDTLSHAYLIECTDRFLLDNFYMFVAKEVFCSNENTPCDECLSCQKVNHGNMVDLNIYPKDNKNIVVDDVNEIVSDTYQKPMDCDKKVYVLKDFDEATTQAQNKILKTIEEPPQNVVFILTCSNINNVLQTIRSRAKIITQPLLDIDQVQKYLEGQNIDNSLNLASVSGGNIYTALKLSESGDIGKIIDLTFNVLMNLKSSADILKFSTQILALKKDFAFFLDAMLGVLRDVAIFHTSKLVNFKNNIKEISYLQGLYSPLAIEKIVESLCEIYNKLDFNCNMTAIVDAMLLDILEVRFLCQK